MIPGTYDFGLVRGSTSPFVVRLKVGSPLVSMVFTDVQLSIYKGSTLLIRKKVSDALAGFSVTNSGEAEITWTPTPVESRLIPTGAKAKYELEVRNGASQEVVLVGTITGIGGLNAD